MGWEDRNGRSYYYRKERTGGRVRSVYVGNSQMAHGLVMLDEMGRGRSGEPRGHPR